MAAEKNNPIILTQTPYGMPGAGCTPEQYNSAISQDTACSTFYTKNNSALRLNPSTSLARTTPEGILKHLKEVHTQLHEADATKAITTPVFMFDKGYEYLLTAVKTHDGGTHFIFTDSMLGKDGFNSRIFNIPTLMKGYEQQVSKGAYPVTFEQNDKAIALEHDGKRILACTVALTGIVYALGDAAAQGTEITPDTIRLHLQPEKMELHPTIDRMNTALTGKDVKTPVQPKAPSGLER